VTTPPHADLSDNTLVEAAQAGDSQAWEELVRRHYVPLLRHLTAQTGDPETAADLTQQTFLDAYRRLARLEPDQPFVPWLFQIARYNFLPWWRRRWVLRHASLEAMVERAGEAVGAFRQADQIEAVGERDAIQQALDRLSPVLREALLLHELEGLTAREVAAALGISEAAAERRIGRALAAFRRRYTALSGEKEHERSEHR
jgi:RNA polymerase sigma factor (sigma-70 family)